MDAQMSRSRARLQQVVGLHERFFSGHAGGLGSPGGSAPNVGSKVSMPKVAMPPVQLLKSDAAPVDVYKIPGGEQGTVATLKLMKKLVMGPWGGRNPQVVMLARRVVQHVGSKDYWHEANAIFEYVKQHVRYRLDPMAMEWIQTPLYSLQTQQADCFVNGTKVLLRDGHKLVGIETLSVGDEIWGLDRWSRVTKVWGDKGSLPTYQVVLNNGSNMRLTPGHKVWVAKCLRHVSVAKPCSCDVESRDVVRVCVSELEKGDCLLTPDHVPFGGAVGDVGVSYVEGLYLSDGWCRKSSFSISGKDGFPKEAQKREVESICRRLGVRTTWYKKSIEVLSKSWAEKMSRMGKLAPAKSALSIDLSEHCAEEFLRGIMADSGKNTFGTGRTFTSTSYDLWLQARVLLKMQGLACSSRYIVDHGGLGTNPIWRLGVRQRSRSDGKRQKLLRVKGVIRDGAERKCFDIETDDHKVWLPEADWTVSQCDDMSSLIAALAIAAGHRAAFVTVAGDKTRPNSYSHVYAMIGVNNKGKTEWLAADATQDTATLGWEPPADRVFKKTVWVIDPNVVVEDKQWR